MPYKLSATLSAHSQDVRAVASPTDRLILSASRDSTAIIWQRDPTASFQPSTVLRAGSRFINAIAFIPPNPDAPQGYVATGGQDMVVNVFNLAAPKDDPDFTLIGHSENVCALHVAQDGTLLSGSWDKTARVWKHFTQAYELRGHQASVWATVAIDHEHFVTGSADKTVKIWQQNKVVRTIQAHTDAVRGLVLVPDIGFASCSNDSQIHVWTLEGDLVYSLSGHESFVYSLALLPTGDIVSGGEDRSVRVWRDGECAQTITHPAISVWTVSAMPNSDIVTGCSDGVVRVFSADESRWAPAADLKAYDDQVASQALPAQQVENMKNVLGPEALTEPGKKPGQVIMVKNAKGGVEAHQWDPSAGWQKVGDVVDAVGSGRKQLYEGKEYDYVFDVDIQDGVPPLKLPFNVTENPFAAAQRFLEQNELPMSYIDQVVDFINKNTQGPTLGANNSQYVDPYTGAARYQSSAASVPTSGGNSYVDPYTGASRYIGSSSAVNPPSAQPPSGGDPFTGQSRYTSTPAPPKAAGILPVRAARCFTNSNVAAMRGKIYEFDQQLRDELSTAVKSIYPQERRELEVLFKYLIAMSEKDADQSKSANPVTGEHIEIITDILERWPRFLVFPMLDLTRLVFGFCQSTFQQPGLRLPLINAILTSSEWWEPWTAPLAKARDTNALLVTRSLTNAFQLTSSYEDGQWMAKVAEALAVAKYEMLGQAQRQGVSSLLFNMSCTFLQAPVEASTRDQHVNASLNVIATEGEDSEAAYRAFVALGNMAWAAKTLPQPLAGNQKAEIRQAASSLPAKFKEDRMRNLASEIQSLL